MTEKELIQEMQDEINHSCALPYNLPEKEVKRIIKRAREWFYANYQWAVETRFIQLPLNLFEHPEFTATRTLTLPDCVVSVFELKEITGTGIIGQQQGDFSDNKLIGAEVFLSPFQGDSLVYRTAMYSYFDLAKAYLLETIAFNYNRNTRRLTVLGRNPRRDCFARGYFKIEEEALYGDEIFVRYCFAQAKIQLGRILGVFDYNLPGGIKVNFDAIKQDGLDELEKIKEQIDAENTPDWFLQWN